MMRTSGSLGHHSATSQSPVIVPEGTPAPPADHHLYADGAPGLACAACVACDGRSTLIFSQSFVLMRFGTMPMQRSYKAAEWRACARVSRRRPPERLVYGRALVL